MYTYSIYALSMARKSDFKSAELSITDFFRTSVIKSFTEKALNDIFSWKREEWDISQSKSVKHLIKFLINEKIFIEHTLNYEKGSRKSIYLSGPFDDFTLFSGIQKSSYYTHYSSMYLHQLTQQIPKTYYLNFEHTSKFPLISITQQAIDDSFSKEQRKTTRYYTYKGKRAYILNGKNTDRHGVIHQLSDTQSYYYTDLERTLIDIAIRPVYSGGVFEVLGAFKHAKNKLDPIRLKEYLEKLQYIYPYEKVIGFYLEKSGYNDKVLQLFTKESPYKFYLTYNIKNKEFSSRWNLYYPKGI